MRPPMIVVLAAAALLLIGACDGDRDPATAHSPSPTPTGAVAAAATATLTATVVATAAPSTSTVEPTLTTATPAVDEDLLGDIAHAIEAAQEGDGARLGDLLTTTDGPCVVDPEPGPLVPPSCPDGVPADTPVPAIVFGGCPDHDGTFIDPAITYFVTDLSGNFAEYLIGVADLGAGPVRYAALFGYEKAFWLGFDDDGQLIGVGGSCATFDLKPRLSDATWLVGPDWSE